MPDPAVPSAKIEKIPRPGPKISFSGRFSASPYPGRRIPGRNSSSRPALRLRTAPCRAGRTHGTPHAAGERHPHSRPDCPAGAPGIRTARPAGARAVQREIAPGNRANLPIVIAFIRNLCIFVPAMNMNREILRIALPNIVSNITVPLMGIVSTAIAGHWGDDSAASIGALAIGVSIFNFIYWNCSFVRMGTSGLTAQAFGAADWRECTRMLARAMAVALVMGVAVLLLQYPLGEAALWAMKGGEMTRAYFYARIWAVPAGILLFGFNGWFTGMQNAVIPMCTAIAVNIVHILCSLWFPQRVTPIAWSEVVDLGPLRNFFRINRDIILRTLCLVAVYTFFTGASARMDDPSLLAVNTLLLQLFTLFSYMNDGFAFAAEALTGRFIGARDGASLRRCLKGCIAWGTAVSVLFVGIYLGWWRELVGLFVDREAHDAAAIVALAGRYIVWIILIPVASAMPFIMDGIMVGATQTRIMRNSMGWATAAYFAIYYAGYPLIGNNALWLAFTLYMFLRGVVQYLMTDRLRRIYAAAEA